VQTNLEALSNGTFSDNSGDSHADPARTVCPTGLSSGLGCAFSATSCASAWWGFEIETADLKPAKRRHIL